MSAIVCHSLTRDFGDVRALDHLTLAVPDGSIFAFLGPNGAGKTTTIHLLLGIIEPTSGSARVLGLDPAIDGQEIRRRSGALLEHTGLYERLSAEQNLRFYARIAHLDEAESDERIGEVLTRFGLYERRDDAVGTWSRGMKQKLAIARALLHRPSLVFLDEPTAGLDPEATVALRRDIASLGTTVFLTTHNLADVEKMATHVAVIRSGRLLDFGTPAELRRRAVRSHVTIRMQDRDPMSLDLAPDESVAPIVTRLVQEGAQIEEVRREEPSIEDVFLHLVRGVQASGLPPGGGTEEAGQRPTLHQRKPVFRDIATVIRKEIREITSSSGTGSSPKVNLTIAAVLMAVVAAIAALVPRDIITGPIALVAVMIAFIVVLAAITDSFPGERERHTLETLLASALPDEALLLGKICASVLYGWTLVLTIVLVILIGANVTQFPAMFPPSILLSILVVAPLSLLLFSALGVMICMRVPTVRAAQPRVTGSFLAFFVFCVIVSKAIPDEWRRQAARAMLTESARLYGALVQIAVLAVLNLIVMAFALVRFKRSRLI